MPNGDGVGLSGSASGPPRPDVAGLQAEDPVGPARSRAAAGDPAEDVPLRSAVTSPAPRAHARAGAGPAPDGETSGGDDAATRIARWVGGVSAAEVRLAQREEAEARADDEAASSQTTATAGIPARRSPRGRDQRATRPEMWVETPGAGLALAVRALADLNPGRWLVDAPLGDGRRGLASSDLVAILLLAMAEVAPDADGAPIDPVVAALAGCPGHLRPIDLFAAWATEPPTRRVAILERAQTAALALTRGRPAHPVHAATAPPPVPALEATRLAEFVLAHLASGLEGFEASSASYVRRSFLDREGAFARLPGELVVAIAPRPLDLVLRRAGQFEPLPHRPWRANEVLTLRGLGVEGQRR
ncbi:MAG: hypothetical protein GVY33_08645 [Alphaproteobacteria bacterium]|nr:hypothetical protein [Alphaproteobacteria bacterium]